MTTTKSYSKPSNSFAAIYKTSLKSQLPLAIALTIVFFVIISVVFFAFIAFEYAEMSYSGSTISSLNNWATGVYLDEAQSYGVLAIVGIISFLLAIFANSYMFSKKQTDLYHSIPVKRSRLLTANLLASMTTVVLPYLAVTIITMVSQIFLFFGSAFFPTNYFSYILLDLLSVIVYAVVVYSFVALIAVNVGTAFDAFSVSGVVGFIPVIVYLIFGALWGEMIYGGTFSANYANILSPFIFISEKADYNLGIGNYLLFLLVAAVIGAIFFFAAILCYNKRKSEIAEKTQPGGVLQIIVKCFISFCGSMIFYQIFNSDLIAVRIIAMLFGALLSGTIAELILSRGFKYYLKNFKWLAVGGGISVLMLLFLMTDLSGYTTRVPEVAQIASISTSYAGRFEDQNYYNTSNSQRLLTSPDSIATVVESHRLAVSNQPPREVGSYYYGNYEDFKNSYIKIEYTLKNGQKINRTYNYINTEALMNFSKLEDNDDFIMANNPLFFDNIYPDLTQEKIIHSISLYNANQTLNPLLYAPSEGELKKLLDAVKSDMLDESFAQITVPSSPAVCYLQFNYKSSQDIYNQYFKSSKDIAYYGDYSQATTILIPSTYSRTLAVLKAIRADEVYAAEQTPPEKIYIFQPDQGEYYSCVVKTVNLYEYIGESYLSDRINRYFNKDSTNQDSYNGISDDNFVCLAVDDTAMISRLMKYGKNQLLLSPNADQEVVAMVYEQEGSLVAFKYILIEDLPESLKSQVKQWNIDPNAQQNYKI